MKDNQLTMNDKTRYDRPSNRPGGGAAASRTNRRSKGTPPWKVSLLASGIGAVMMGWALLAQAAPATGTQLSTGQSSSTVAQAPSTSAASGLGSGSTLGLSNNSGSSNLGQFSVPTFQQQPFFSRPLTRSRGS